MPIVTLTVQRDSSADRSRHAVLDAVHDALVGTGVPATDRFQRVLALDAAALRIDATYPDLAEPRDADFALIEIRWSAGRSVKVKRTLLATLMAKLASLGLRPENVMVSFEEVRWEDWSFAGGRLLHADA